MKDISPDACLTALESFFKQRGYRIGADVSGLLAKRQDSIANFVTDYVVGFFAGMAHIPYGPTGTKRVTAEDALRALEPFIKGTNLVAWKGSDIIPVSFSDGWTTGEAQQHLQDCLKAAVNAANALSITKYGGFSRVFPILLCYDAEHYEKCVSALRLEDKSTSFWLRSQLFAGLLNVREMKVHWAAGLKANKQPFTSDELRAAFTL